MKPRLCSLGVAILSHPHLHAALGRLCLCFHGIISIPSRALLRRAGISRELSSGLRDAISISPAS